jgi:hypothetical protein
MTSCHDDYGKTIDDIEKRFLAFNCKLKKLNGDFFLFYRTTGSPVTGDLSITGALGHFLLDFLPKIVFNLAFANDSSN